MRKLSDETIGKTKELRKEGLTVREIGTRLRLSPATVFYYARDVERGSEKQALSLGNEPTDDAITLYLPFTIICPHCGEEKDCVELYYETGSFYCISTDTSSGCGKEINLRTAPRKDELSIK